MKEVKSEVEVYETSDYGLFDLVPGNRKVVRDHTLTLKRAIEKRNLLHLYPIIVSPEGKVLDGQHRLAAARELKVPLFYVVSENGTDIMDIALTNHASKHWTREDYLTYWCEKGKEHYVVLKEFWGKYDWMSLSTASAICVGEPANSTLSNTQRNLFNQGEYKIMDMRFATMFASACKDFLAVFKFATERPFMAALSELLRNSRYDQERMKEKLERYPGMLIRCPDKTRYLEVLEELYNYHGRGEKVRFS